jgi:hypothetical protein
MNNLAVQQDAVDVPKGGGTELGELYQRRAPEYAQPEQASYEYEDDNMYYAQPQPLPKAEISISDDQKRAALVFVLCLVFASPYVQKRISEFVPEILISPVDPGAWPRITFHALLVAVAFYLVRHFLIKH